MKKVIGITGGIASGKTNISTLLRKRGFLVIDADEITKQLSEKGGAVYLKIVESFGTSFLNEDQTINRLLLGKHIFQNQEARQKLNDISHPLIVEEIKRQIEEHEEEVVFVDIPLLYEANLTFLCSKIICCYVPYRIQLKRLMNRDQISKEYARSKIKSQMSLKKKKKLSDYVIHTAHDFYHTENQLNQIINQIKGEEYGNI